jgi:hypothetical protein
MNFRWLALAGVFLSAVAFSQEYSIGRHLLISHPSDSYRSDIWLRAVSQTEDTSVEFRFSGTEYYLPLRRPLHLTAIQGEERRYLVDFRVLRDGRVVQASQQSYTIDKRSPPTPVLEPESGVYIGSVRLRLSSVGSSTAQYTVDRPLTFEPEPWPGSDVVITSDGTTREVTVRVRTVDEAGNRSEETQRQYTILPEGSVPTELSVVSPVPGEFGNPQLLFVEAPATWRIYYGFDDTDPTANGTLYTAPVVLPGSGSRTVHVVAQDPTGEWHRRQVAYSQGTNAPLNVQSGAYDESVTVSASDPTLRYTLGERLPDSDDPFLSENLELTPQPGLFRRQPLVLRDESGRVYRYLFLLEGREPGPPRLDLQQDREQAVLAVGARPGARILYTVGSEDVERVYTGRVRLDLPDQTEEGRLSVSAKAVLSSGIEGPTETAELAFDTSAPPAPQVELTPVATGLRIAFDPPHEGRVVYELGEREPDVESPQLQSGSVLEVPFGSALDTRLSVRTLDGASNLSRDSAVHQISIDRLPPPTPVLTIEDGEVRIEGRGTLLYQVEPDVAGATDDEAFADSPIEGFQLYQSPFSLPGRNNRRVEYSVVAIALDEAGNTSPTAERLVVVNRRNPTVPPLAGLVPGGVYNLPQLTVSFRDPDPDLELFYTVTRDGSEPEAPTLEDQRYTGPFQLSGREGEEIVFRLKFLPHYPGIPRSGDIREISLVLDLEPPQLPEVAGVDNGEVMAATPLIELVPVSGEDTVFYSIGSPADVDALGPSGIIYSNPFEIDVPVGEERELALDIAVRDAAGNVRRIADPITFTVDRRPPAAPSYRVDGETVTEDAPTFGSDVRVSLESEEAIYYEVTSDGRVPPVPGPTSTAYEDRINLSGIDGAVVQYNLAAVAIDQAGNRSPLLEVLGLAIDREPPPRAPEPIIRPVEEGTAVQIAWEPIEELDLFFRLMRGETDSDLREFTDIVQVDLPEGDTVLSLLYFYQDEAGNRGPTRTTEIAMRAKPRPPQLEGVEAEALYSSAVTISASSGSGEVRYEIAEVPDSPAPVTRFSALLADGLVVDVPEGSTAEYRVRVRRFVGERVSEPVSLSFTIDRSPPPAPRLVGVRPGGYYEDEQVVTLEAEEGTVFVALRRNAGAAVGVDDLDFREYDGPIRLAAEEGDLASYSVFAYARDRAGNQSRPVASWEIFIDREVIYVSPAGDDGGEGSRGDPFATLERALEYVRASERSTVFMAEGSYTVGEPIRVDDTLSLVGGYDAESWQRLEGGRSSLRRGRAVRDTRAMFLVDSGSMLNLSGVTISEAKGFWEAVVENDGGTVAISDSRFVISGRSQAIVFRDGSLAVTGTSIEMSRTSAGAAIEGAGGSAELRGVSLDLRQLVSPFDVIRASKSRLIVSDSRIVGTDGWTINGISSEGGDVRLRELNIVLSSARESVTGIAVSADSAELIEVNVGISDSPYALGIRLENGEALLQDGEISITDVDGGTGVILKDVSARLDRSTVAVTDARQFSYGISALGGVVDVGATVLEADADGEAFLSVVENTAFSLVHTTGRVGGEPRICGGVNATGGGRLSVVNSILLGPRRGTAVATDATVEDGGTIAGNFAGWSTVARRGDSIHREVRDLNRRYRNLLVLGKLSSFVENHDYGDDELFSADGFPRLTADSPVVDRGVELEEWPSTDIDGEPMPRNRRDIGADEYHPTGR